MILETSGRTAKKADITQKNILKLNENHTITDPYQNMTNSDDNTNNTANQSNVDV